LMSAEETQTEFGSAISTAAPLQPSKRRLSLKKLQ
jgi:hypothetical protein